MSCIISVRLGAERTVDSPIAVLVGFPDHLIDLIVRQLFPNGRHDVAEFGRRDEAVVVTIEDLERFPDFFLGIGILHFARHHGQELWSNMSDTQNAWSGNICARQGYLLAGPRTGKVDCAVVVCVHLVDHILQLGFAGVLAERSHDGS